MKFGFIKVGSASPRIEVANPKYNAEEIKKYITKAKEEGVKILVFPELGISGYTLGDLFLQDALINSANQALEEIVRFSEGTDMISIVGMPLEVDSKLYNTAVVIQGGDILGIVAKTHLPNYSEFYEQRHFKTSPEENLMISLGGREVILGNKLLFRHITKDELCFSVEICEDLWVTTPPSNYHAEAGANIIFNLSASNETVGKKEYRKELVKSQSARCFCGYVYASAGTEESTTDLAFSGHNLIAEDGVVLKESPLFENNMITSEIDLSKITIERRRYTTFETKERDDYDTVYFDMEITDTEVTREYERHPFVPMNNRMKCDRCSEVFDIQTVGLSKRMRHTGIDKLILGLSGGLDSTLALLACINTVDKLGLGRENIIAITMPGFGTSDRTYKNVNKLAEMTGITLREIDIKKAVKQHFKDIGHDENVHDSVFENAQARERTQILMDIANAENGLVVGTGDMSELALGWATYNGDQMSMYGINAGIPKTLVKHLVIYAADNIVKKAKLSEVLYDIAETPVSPELLPVNEEKEICPRRGKETVMRGCV